MSGTSLALGRQRPRERETSERSWGAPGATSWEHRKAFSVAWSSEPFYDPERIFEKQRRQSAAATSPDLSADASASPLPEQQRDDDGFFADWDGLDVAASLGIALLIMGFILALIPNTRNGGILFPIGALIMAIAAYAARNRDQDQGQD